MSEDALANELTGQRISGTRRAPAAYDASVRRVSILLLTVACGAAPTPLEPAHDAPAEVNVPPASGSATTSPPTGTARAGACVLPAAEAQLSLSVDGTEDGVFVIGMAGHTGELSIDPAGRSTAKVDYGVMHFDAALSLASTTLRATFIEEPIGGILHLSPDAQMVITGGTADKLELRPLDTGDVLHWAAVPTQRFSCDALRRRPPPRPMPVLEPGKRSVELNADQSGVRASEQGPVVAHLRVGPATVLQERNGSIRIRVSTSMGEVVGWVDAKEWQAPRPRPPGKPSPLYGYGTSGSAPPPVYARCALGSPVFLLRDGKASRVGRIWEMGDRTLTDSSFDIEGGLKTKLTSATDPKYVVPEDLLNVTEERQIILSRGDLVVEASSCK
jgi:hypothetical protein